MIRMWGISVLFHREGDKMNPENFTVEIENDPKSMEILETISK